VRDENVTDDQQQQQKATEVLQLLHKHCSDAQLQSAVGLEATFVLPATYRDR